MTNKWLNEYQGLRKYKKNQLYCITGPFILGIELVKLPRIDKYRPHFVVYSLYGNPTGTNLKECMMYPIIMFELFNSKNLQYSLDFEGVILEAKESLDSFLNFKLGENISFEYFLNWFDQITNDPNLKFRIRLPEIWEAQYNLAVYFSIEKATQVFNEIKNSAEKIDKEKCFKAYGGYTQWFKKLEAIDSLEQLNLIKKNKNNELLKHLLSFEVV